MNIDSTLFRSDERFVYILRSLYSRYGYSRFKMSKFEEYDLYVRNKDYLISDGVITFTDTNGKLMALKPDVTFSIIKNNKFEPGTVQRYYYNENVYRVSKDTNSFKEIMQAGCECIGDIDNCCILEVLTLAAESLRSISPDSLLSLSYLDFVAELVDGFGVSREVQQQLFKCIGQKNAHGITEIYRDCGIQGAAADALLELVNMYGTIDEVMPKLRAVLDGVVSDESVARFEAVVAALCCSGIGDMLRIDFSVVSDMKYYNGIVFKGFVSGVPNSVLSGGQYDRLMQRMGHRSRAIGFAVYLDMLERSGDNAHYDADLALIYDDTADLQQLRAAAERLSAGGERVALQRALPQKARYKRVMQFKDGEVSELEANA